MAKEEKKQMKEENQCQSDNQCRVDIFKNLYNNLPDGANTRTRSVPKNYFTYNQNQKGGGIKSNHWAQKQQSAWDKLGEMLESGKGGANPIQKWRETGEYKDAEK